MLCCYTTKHDYWMMNTRTHVSSRHISYVPVTSLIQWFSNLKSYHICFSFVFCFLEKQKSTNRWFCMNCFTFCHVEAVLILLFDIFIFFIVECDLFLFISTSLRLCWIAVSLAIIFFKQKIRKSLYIYIDIKSVFLYNYYNIKQKLNRFFLIRIVTLYQRHIIIICLWLYITSSFFIFFICVNNY